jgi:alpha-tubulin suppressor-like RCC1 family protein
VFHKVISAENLKVKLFLKFGLVLMLWQAAALQAATTVTNIAIGVFFANFASGHSLFIKSDGSLWAFGNTGFGQLGGDPRNIFSYRPEEIISNGVVAAALGGGFSMFVKSDGSLWAIGENSNGALGDGRVGGSTNQPEQIVSNGVVAVACGGASYLVYQIRQQPLGLWGQSIWRIG